MEDRVETPGGARKKRQSEREAGLPTERARTEQQGNGERDAEDQEVDEERGQECAAGRDQAGARRRGRPSKAEQLGRERAFSIGSLAEYVKRKREPEAGLLTPKPFKESAKTPRSPQEGGGRPGMEDLAGKAQADGKEGEAGRDEDLSIKQMLGAIMGELRGMREEREKNKQDRKEELRRLKSDILEEMEEKLKAAREEEREERRREKEAVRVRVESMEERWEEEGRKLEERLQNMMRSTGGESEQEGGLEERVRTMGEEQEEVRGYMRRAREREEVRKRQGRRLNIVIKGIGGEAGQERGEMGKLLQRKLGVRGEPEEVWRVGKDNGTMLAARMRSWEEKQKVMQRKRNLRDTAVYLEHDRTRREREVQSKIVAWAREEKAKGREVRVGYRTLVVEGVRYAWDDEREEIVRSRREQERAEADGGRGRGRGRGGAAGFGRGG